MPVPYCPENKTPIIQYSIQGIKMSVQESDSQRREGGAYFWEDTVYTKGENSEFKLSIFFYFY